MRGLGVPGGDALAGAAPDFPGAGDALAVGGAEAGGAGGVGGGELSVEPRRAVGGEQGAGLAAGGFAGVGDVRQTAGKGGEIEAGAAAEDGDLAILGGFGHFAQSLGAPPGDAAGVGGGAHTIEAMGGGGFVLLGGAGSDEAEFAVDLHGIGVDDDAVVGAGEGEGEGGFAAGGGAGDDEGARDLRGTAASGIAAGMYILTLIAARSHTNLDLATIAAVRDAVESAAVTVLSPGEAVEMACSTEPDAAQVRALLAGRPVDAIVTPAQGRRKKLLIADMDSTIVTSETLDELAGFAGLKDEIAAVTARAMNGELEFKEALRFRVALLKGLKLDALEQTWQGTRLMPGAVELVRTMKAHGAFTALVSGGFTFFTSRVAALCGFDVHRSNVLPDDGAVLTGLVAEPILDKDSKRASLIELAAARGIGLEATLAVGDGANDLPMIQAAGLGVAFHAKPAVAAVARAQIRYGDLRGVLFAQGYKAGEFVGD